MFLCKYMVIDCKKGKFGFAFDSSKRFWCENVLDQEKMLP